MVYLLRELSKRHKDIWVKVGDGDGEFLLIEAAGTLPAWLEPEVADNRVGSNGRHLLKIGEANSGILSHRSGLTKEVSKLSSLNKLLGRK